MHYQLYPFRGSIIAKFGYIKIRIRFCKTVNVFFVVRNIVFPTLVPAFHQYSIKTVSSGKVYVFHHVLGVSSVVVMRVFFVCPSRTSSNKVFPPYPYVFYRLYPRSIFYFARLIQVEYQVRSYNITSIITYNNSTPRAHSPCLYIATHPILVGY